MSDAPFTRNGTFWSGLLQRARNVFGRPADLSANSAGTPAAELVATPPHQQPLSAQYLKASPNTSAITSGPSLAFNSFSAEALLDEAGLLVDRALTARVEWNVLRSRSYIAALEFEEFAAIDDLHQEETQHGYYTLGYREAERLAEAEASALTSYQNTFNQSDSNATRIANGRNRMLNDAIANGRIHLLPVQQGKDGNDDDINYPAQWMDPSTQPDFPGNQAHFLADWAKPSIGRLATDAIDSIQAAANIERESAAAMLAAAKGRADAADLRKQWAACDVRFRRRRTEIARNGMLAKYQEATTPDGALNFAAQMAPIAQRIMTDQHAAFDRLPAIHEGLERIFGYSATLPSSTIAAINGTASQQECSAALDDTAQWIRDASDWLTRFAHADHAWAQPISMRAIDKNGWFEAFRQGGRLMFTLEESHFPQARYVRVRGVSLFVSGVPVDALFTAQLQPPGNTFTRRADGSNVPFDQSSLGSVVLSRVGVRQSERAPDIAGATLFRNASPFGIWTLDMSDKSVTDVTERKAITDVFLEVYVAARRS